MKQFSKGEILVQIQELQLNTNLLSLGAILGTSGHQDLIRNINAQSGAGSYFGSMSDPFRTGFQVFMSTVVEPIRQVQNTLLGTANKLLKQDVYRPITNVKELEEGIPPCMQLGVIYYQPIRQMLEEERIDGFGIDPKTLWDEDPYESVINSGRAIIHSSLLGENGEYDITWTEKSIDPEMTIEEKYALEMTRDFIDEFIEDEDTKHMDFTDFPSLHC